MSHEEIEDSLRSNQDSKSSRRSEDNYSELFLTCLIQFITTVQRLELLLGKVIMNQAELAAQLNADADKAAKVNAEVLALLEIIANQTDVNPELQAAADRVSSAIQGLDDLNADIA